MTKKPLAILDNKVVWWFGGILATIIATYIGYRIITPPERDNEYYADRCNSLTIYFRVKKYNSKLMDSLSIFIQNKSVSGRIDRNTFFISLKKEDIFSYARPKIQLLYNEAPYYGSDFQINLEDIDIESNCRCSLLVVQKEFSFDLMMEEIAKSNEYPNTIVKQQDTGKVEIAMETKKINLLIPPVVRPTRKEIIPSAIRLTTGPNDFDDDFVGFHIISVRVNYETQRSGQLFPFFEYAGKSGDIIEVFGSKGEYKIYQVN